MGGCRCVPCRAANSRYEVQRAALRKQGLGNGLTSAKPARDHLLMLSKMGVGRRAVSDAAGVPQSTITKIKNLRRTQIRKDTERRILSVGISAAKDRALIKAKPVWKLIAALLEGGFTRRSLARRLGYKSSLQFRKGRITVINAMKVIRLHTLIMTE